MRNSQRVRLRPSAGEIFSTPGTSRNQRTIVDSDTPQSSAKKRGEKCLSIMSSIRMAEKSRAHPRLRVRPVMLGAMIEHPSEER